MHKQAGFICFSIQKQTLNVLIYHGDQVKERQQSRDRKLSAKRTLKDLKD